MRSDILLDRLERVRATGQSEWLACCPAHPDKSPSLSVREKSGGRILINCFAGCDVDDVMQAVGLSVDDLYPEGARAHHQSFLAPRPTSLKSTARLATGMTPDIAGNVLKLCEAARARGERLPPDDLEQERRCFEYLRDYEKKRGTG